MRSDTAKPPRRILIDDAMDGLVNTKMLMVLSTTPTTHNTINTGTMTRSISRPSRSV